MRILKQLKKTIPFKVMGFKEMRDQSEWTRLYNDYEYDEYDDEFYINQKTWWQRVQESSKKLIDYVSGHDRMRVKIIQLQRRLVGLTREAQDAGSVGLNLLNENENLKAQLDIAKKSADPAVFGKFWIEKERFDKLNRELEEMKKKNLEYLNMYEDMNQQRVDAFMRADALRSELNKLKEKKNGESNS